MTVLEAIEIEKKFGDAPPLFQGLCLSVDKGESVAIMGSSGVGKSTLLHILGHLDTPDRGEVLFQGKQVIEPATFRNHHLGFVFQSYHLLEDFSVMENVLMPLRIARKPLSDGNLLEKVGLAGKEKQLARTLSGGEKQRVAIARALANHPDVVLADEPTGNLDAANSAEIQKLLLESVKDQGCALIVVTHDPDFAKLCDRILFLNGGGIYTEPQ